MFNLLIVDDEPLARKLLSEHATKLPELQVVGQCQTAIEAQRVLREQRVDILLLDIQMPDLTGLEFLRTLQPRPATILTTAYAEYAVEGYDLEVVDYLLKPIVFERFFKAMSRALSQVQPDQPAQALAPTPTREAAPRSLFLKTDHRLVQVQCADIRYIEGLREYVRVHTTQEQLIVLQSLSRLLDALPLGQFARIHRSYIVGIAHIDSIIGNTVYLGDTELPISKGQREAFLAMINRQGLF